MRQRRQKPQTEEHKRIKKADVILISAFLIAGLVGVFWLSAGREDGRMVRVTVDGKEAGTYPLSRDDTIRIEGVGGSNTLVIRDGQAAMEEADCPDRICVEHAPVDSVGETIVCLPHRVVVEVLSEEGGNEEGQTPEFDGVAR